MASKTASSVYFVDGCVLDKDYVYLASRLDDLDPNEYDHSRMFFMDADQWLSHDLEWDVKSVCVIGHAPNRRGIALSLQGDVEIQSVSGATLEKIPGAGTMDGRGAMTQIRAIGNELVACGYGAQVYRRGGQGWLSMAQGLEELTSEDMPVDLNSIDGNAIDDLYAVGYFGRIFHFNGQTWRELDSPTNVHLERVRVREGKALVCGNDGTLLVGDKAGFAAFGDPAVRAHFWGVEYFRGKAYLAALDGLYTFDGKTMTRVVTGLTPQPGAYRLDVGDDVLWSFGAKDLVRFDGKKWRWVRHPDNP